MLTGLTKRLGFWTLGVIAITLGLFVAALFTRGFTHDLLLEAAVFLISVKLIIMTYRSSQGVEEIKEKLDQILNEEKHLEQVLETLRRNRKNDSRKNEGD